MVGRSRSLSPLPPRKRRRSPARSRSTSPGDDRGGGGAKRRCFDLAVEVCKDFIRDACRRSPIDCKFAHPHSSVSIERDRVVACADSLRNKCFRGRTCRYYHPVPHIQESLLKALGFEEPKADEVCRDFVRGRCSRNANECRYSHHLSVDDSTIVCQDYLRGKCERKSCRYTHFAMNTRPQVYVLQPYTLPMELASTLPRMRNDQELLEVCRDFLKKMCKRDSCRYAHPDSKTKVVDNQVEVCRDFRRGICQRNTCRFYHPSTSISDTR